MAEEDKRNMQVAAPAFEWKWNVNTIAVLVGFAAGFVAWGYTFSEMKNGLAGNAADIDRLTERLVAVERSVRQIDNHELHIANVEKQATDAAGAMREVNATLNGLAADMRVTRETLQRIKATKTGQRQP